MSDDVSPEIIKHYVDELEEKLKQQSKAPEQTLSKWAKMVQRIESKSFEFCRFLGLLSNILILNKEISECK